MLKSKIVSALCHRIVTVSEDMFSFLPQPKLILLMGFSGAAAAGLTFILLLVYHQPMPLLKTSSGKNDSLQTPAQDLPKDYQRFLSFFSYHFCVLEEK